MTKTSTALLAGLGLAFGASAGSAAPIMFADFEAFTVGAPPPTGALPDRPFELNTNLIVTVENSGTVAGPTLPSGNFLHMGESPGEAPNLNFDVGTSFTTGSYRVAMDLLFENFETYNIYIRNGTGSGLPPASQAIADIQFGPDGTVRFSSLGGFWFSTYEIGSRIVLDAIFDLDADSWSASLNGSPVVTGQEIRDGFLGQVGVGFEFTSFTPGPGFDGRMQLDNFVFEQVPEPGSLGLLALGLIGGALARRRPRLREP